MYCTPWDFDRSFEGEIPVGVSFRLLGPPLNYPEEILIYDFWSQKVENGKSLLLLLHLHALWPIFLWHSSTCSMGDIFVVESFNVDRLSDGSCVHVTFNWGSVSIWWEGVEV